MRDDPISQAYEILDRSKIFFEQEPVGTLAAKDPNLSAANYEECFIRDFVPSAIVYLLDGDYEIVKNFLVTVMKLRGQQQIMAGHHFAEGLMPASFAIDKKDSKETIIGDFGDRAIGRVAPVDSALWWMIILRSYTRVSGDTALAETDDFQHCIKCILQLYLNESFETSPAMLVPDGSFMMDRRMGVHGHPLEIQALFYGMLLSADELLIKNENNSQLIDMVKKRLQTLRSYVRLYYWLDVQRLNEIHRYKSEEFGWDVVNVLNIYPDIIPEWIDGWLSDETGYLVGNVGPGKIDFRFFTQGNFLSVLFGLSTEEQNDNIMNIFDIHWKQLMGQMPIKIVYPAVTGKEWALMTGNDPKNVAWSYHNGGNWPCLLWSFTAAALKSNRKDLARKAMEITLNRLPSDLWSEYYDGKYGSLVGRRSNLYQTWSATSVIISHHLIESPKKTKIFRDSLFFT